MGYGFHTLALARLAGRTLNYAIRFSTDSLSIKLLLVSINLGAFNFEDADQAREPIDVLSIDVYIIERSNDPSRAGGTNSRF